MLQRNASLGHRVREIAKAEWERDFREKHLLEVAALCSDAIVRPAATAYNVEGSPTEVEREPG